MKHARYYWLLLAGSHLTRRLFASMVRRIELLPLRGLDMPAKLRLSVGTQEGEGRVSEESLQGGPVLGGPGEAKTGLFDPSRVPAVYLL